MLLPKIESAGSVKAALQTIQANPRKGGAEIERAVADLKKLGYTSGS